MKKVLLALLLMMISTNLSASVPVKITKEWIDSELRALTQSCEDGDAKACAKVGDTYNYADDVEQDSVKAEKYYKIACKGKEYVSCGRLAAIYESRNEQDKSARFYKLACDNGDDDSCSNVGSNYMSGTGERKDLSMAIVYFKKSAKSLGLDCAGKEKHWSICMDIKKCEHAMAND